MDIFPALHGRADIAALILRIVLGGTLAYFAWLKIRGRGASSGSNSTRYGVVELIIAVFLLVGLYTQLCAFLNALILVIKLFFKYKEGKLFSDGINYYILLLSIAVALLFMSPGMWALEHVFH